MVKNSFRKSAMEKLASAAKLVLLAALAWASGCCVMDLNTPEPERAARKIAKWLETNLVDDDRIKIVEKEGLTVVETSIPDFPSFISSYDLEVSIDGSSRIVLCECTMPLSLEKYQGEALTNVIEFIFRSQCEYGLSPANFIILKDGDVVCRTWLPLDEVLRSPNSASDRLVGSAFEKIHVLGRLFLFSQPPKPIDVQAVTPQGLFDSLCRGDKDSIETDAKDVLEACFDNGGYVLAEDEESWVVKRFVGKRAAKVVASSVTGLKDSANSPYDELRYSLIVRNGMVWNICELPVEIPKERLADVACALMRINEFKVAQYFGVDFDNRKVWCQYGIPVCALDKRKGIDRGNMNGLLKNTAPMCLAENTRKICAIAFGTYSATGNAEGKR